MLTASEPLSGRRHNWDQEENTSEAEERRGEDPLREEGFIVDDEEDDNVDERATSEDNKTVNEDTDADAVASEDGYAREQIAAQDLFRRLSGRDPDVDSDDEAMEEDEDREPSKTTRRRDLKANGFSSEEDNHATDHDEGAEDEESEGENLMEDVYDQGADSEEDSDGSAGQYRADRRVKVKKEVRGNKKNRYAYSSEEEDDDEDQDSGDDFLDDAPVPRRARVYDDDESDSAEETDRELKAAVKESRRLARAQAKAAKAVQSKKARISDSDDSAFTESESESDSEESSEEEDSDSAPTSNTSPRADDEEDEDVETIASQKVRNDIRGQLGRETSVGTSRARSEAAEAAAAAALRRNNGIRGNDAINEMFTGMVRSRVNAVAGGSSRGRREVLDSKEAASSSNSRKKRVIEESEEDD